MSNTKYLLRYLISQSFLICSFQGTSDTSENVSNGDGEIRTLDPLLARQVLSQLSYTPKLA